MNPKKLIEILISFDRTGSMFPCLAIVRQQIRNALRSLFQEHDNLRIGIIAHADWCDEARSQILLRQDFTRDIDVLEHFLNGIDAAGGCGPFAGYEVSLRTANQFNWTPGSTRVMLVIGDEIPHEPHERVNKLGIDWRKELAQLRSNGVTDIGVQALNEWHSHAFYSQFSFHLRLDQFAYALDLVKLAIYREMDVTFGSDYLRGFYDAQKLAGRANYAFENAYDVLLGVAPRHPVVQNAYGSQNWAPRRPSTATGKNKKFAGPIAYIDDFIPVQPGRFQAMPVFFPSNWDAYCRRVAKKKPNQLDIRGFVEANSIPYVPGRGFYKLVKPEDLRSDREVILRDQRTGQMFTGLQARLKLNAPMDVEKKVYPSDVPAGFDAFLQSSSYNRVLEPSRDEFLYEILGKQP